MRKHLLMAYIIQTQSRNHPAYAAYDGHTGAQQYGPAPSGPSATGAAYLPFDHPTPTGHEQSYRGQQTYAAHGEGKCIYALKCQFTGEERAKTQSPECVCVGFSFASYHTCAMMARAQIDSVNGIIARVDHKHTNLGRMGKQSGKKKEMLGWR